MRRKLGNRFFLFFFLVDDQNATSFSVCKLALDASFQQIDRKHNCLYFTFLRGKYLFFPRKNTNDIWLRIPLGLFLSRGGSSRRRYVFCIGWPLENSRLEQHELRKPTLGEYQREQPSVPYSTLAGAQLVLWKSATAKSRQDKINCFREPTDDL